MMYRYGFRELLGVVCALSGAILGCGGDTQESPDCAKEDKVGSEKVQCAGVPVAAVCSSEACTEGVECAKTVEAATDAELEKALKGSSAGTCVVIAQGDYGAVSLPGGVSLLGRSAGEVTVAGLTIEKGAGAVIRGISVKAGGVKVNGATGAELSSVRISSSMGIGLDVAAGSSVKMTASSITGSRQYGVNLVDGASVTLDSTIIEDSLGPGVWAACSGGCGMCSAPPDLTMTNSIVRDNRIGGISLFGTTAKFETIAILGTREGGEDFHPLEGGGGLSVAGCSDLTAHFLQVQDSVDYGVLVDQSLAKLGDDNQMDGINISRNLRGFWVQHIEQMLQMDGKRPVEMRGALITENRGVSVGVSGGTQGFILCKTHVANTAMEQLPVKINGTLGGQQGVGDGVVSSENSGPVLQEITLAGNARANILIDGPSGGSITNITSDKEVKIQGVKMTDPMPMHDDSVMGKPTEDRPLGVATPPAAPTGGL